MVAGGHQSDPPKEDSYSVVVEMEVVRLGFILAILNDLQGCAADIGNTFFYGTKKEKVYIIAAPDFGLELEGKRMIIERSLYGLKTSWLRFHENLSKKLRGLGF